MSKLTSACPQEQLEALNSLKSFEPFWIFYRNLWHGSQKSIYVSRVKIAEETVFWFFFSEFFPIFSENFFRLSARKLQENVKTTFWVSRGTICSLKFFFKSFESFRIFCKNLWHGSQKSIYVSRVKNAEKTSFLLFSFQNLFDFWAKIFQTFGQKTSRKCENYLLRVHRNNLWLYIFLKSFEPFWIFYRNLWHGSQNSIYVSRVKILEETDFLFFFSEVFRILSENF